MTDYVSTEDVKQCSKCGETKVHSKFSASNTTNDGKQAWCKKCHKQYKADAGKKAAKALKRLPSSELLAKTIMDECSRNGVRIVKSRPDDGLAKARKAVGPEFDKAWRWVDDVLKQRRMAKLGSVVDAAYAKAQALATKANAEASIAKSKASIAKSREKRRQMTAQMNDTRTALEKSERGLRLRLKKIEQGIAVVTSNYERAALQAAKTQERMAAREAERVERDRDEWTFKASTTNDPILRAAFLARAEGKGLIDDDEY